MSQLVFQDVRRRADRIDQAIDRPQEEGDQPAQQRGQGQ